VDMLPPISSSSGVLRFWAPARDLE